MAFDPSEKKIYHITDIQNLKGILSFGYILSDANMRNSGIKLTEIGYDHVKQRRLTEYRISCCGGRFVGEFVPFYFCPRSPMLFTINKGNTGRKPGCQRTILHLVSTVKHGYDLKKAWAISDGNAGSAYTTFANDSQALDRVNWEIVDSQNWAGDRMHKKATEFLIADSFPITSFIGIGCQNQDVADEAREILNQHGSKIPVKVFTHWYY